MVIKVDMTEEEFITFLAYRKEVDWFKKEKRKIEKEYIKTIDTIARNIIDTLIFDEDIVNDKEKANYLLSWAYEQF